MNNYRNNNRKNRFRSNGDRNFRKRSLNIHKNQNDYGSNIEFRNRNSSRGNINPAKLVEKYNNLAREALSSGDKILSENYLQHAEHFSRILSSQETAKISNSDNVIEKNFKKETENITEEKKNETAVNNENKDIN